MRLSYISCHHELVSEKQYNILQWPALTSNMNPIESLWNIADKKLTKYGSKTVNELEQPILKLRSEIPTETCRDLVTAMPNYINTCMRVKGSTFPEY